MGPGAVEKRKKFLEGKESMILKKDMSLLSSKEGGEENLKRGRGICEAKRAAE